MPDTFFTRPSINSPYEHPTRYWELDAEGQPTHRLIDRRRRAELGDVYGMEADFGAKAEAAFDGMIEGVLA